MKKFTVVCLLIFACAFCFAASEELEMYKFLYTNTQTHEDQLALLQGMAEMKISGAGEFYANALTRLIQNFPNISGANEKMYAENQAILLANLIGQEKYSGAAGDLWRTYESFSDPLVKAEALMTLGKIRAVEFLPRVVRVMKDKNESPGNDRLSEERIAYGAVISLEKFGDMTGYLPVYFASKGWYTQRVKSQASRSLKVISADPTEPMISVITGAEYIYEIKLDALQFVNTSDVSKESKSKAALAALNEGWTSGTTDTRQQGQLNTMRKFAMRMIRENGCSDNAVYALLERSYKQFAEPINIRAGAGDRDEALDAISTLSFLATDEAVKKLSDFLMTINGKMQSGALIRNDEDMIRAIIPAIGATKNANGRQALNVVNALNWTSAVKVLARDALAQLP